MTPAIVISTCALLFTVGSFWWLYVRPGRLRMTQVRVFSADVRRDLARLRIPVTLYNTGPRPLVVVDLRLQVSSDGVSATAPSRSFRRSIKAGPDDLEDLPHPYVVPGRSVVTTFVEFTVDPRVISTGEPATAALSVLDDRKSWHEVGATEVRTDSIGDPGSYLTYSNDPAHWPPGQLARARKALAAVRSALPEPVGLPSDLAVETDDDAAAV